MSVISFDEWKKQNAAKKQASGNAHPQPLDKQLVQEQTVYELCLSIAEENAADLPDYDYISLLWTQLREFCEQTLSYKQHAYHYFLAFEAFWQEDTHTFFQSFEAFLQSETIIFDGHIDNHWWTEYFVELFTPAFPSMYTHCAALLFQYFPNCAMGTVFLALEQNQISHQNRDAELELLQKAFGTDPNCMLAAYLIAMIHFDEQRWNSALHYFREASNGSLYEEDPSFYFDYAFTAERAGKYALALALYEKCLELNESYPTALNHSGMVLLQLGKNEEALRKFQYAISMEMDGVLSYQNVVVALEHMQKYDECIEFIQANLAVLGSHYLKEIEKLRMKTFSVQRFPELSNQETPLPLDASLLESRKSLLESYLEQQMAASELIFGHMLEVYQDENGYGRKYYVPNAGCVDFLCIDQKTNDFCLLLVSPGVADESYLISAGLQRRFVREHLATDNQKVEVYILALDDISSSFSMLMKDSGFDSIFLYHLKIAFEKSFPATEKPIDLK